MIHDTTLVHQTTNTGLVQILNGPTLSSIQVIKFKMVVGTIWKPDKILPKSNTTVQILKTLRLKWLAFATRTIFSGIQVMSPKIIWILNSFSNRVFVFTCSLSLGLLNTGLNTTFIKARDKFYFNTKNLQFFGAASWQNLSNFCL
jgi:hypothetical protein